MASLIYALLPTEWNLFLYDSPTLSSFSLSSLFPNPLVVIALVILLNYLVIFNYWGFGAFDYPTLDQPSFFREKAVK